VVVTAYHAGTGEFIAVDADSIPLGGSVWTFALHDK